MELIDAYEIVNVSPEEKDSIGRYLGSRHTGMNILADLTPERYDVLKSVWNLPKIEEELKKSITDFVNIYSAMYKESKEKDYKINLIRGTNRQDVPKKGGEINQFLSASIDKEIPKRFAEYQNAAILRLSVDKDVPFLNVENYRDEDSVDEQEIIIAPFCNVSRSDFASEYNGYSYHDVTVTKPQLEELSDEEVQAVMQEVINGFAQNIEDMKECVKLSDKYEILTEKIRKGIQDKEDLKYIVQEKEEIFEKYCDKKAKTTSFKQNLQKLLKGLCKQKQIEIDKAHEVIETEQKRIQEETRKKAEEERRKEESRIQEIDRKNKFSELDTKSLRLPSQSQDLQFGIEEAYQRLIQIENECKSRANKFGITYSKSVLSTEIAKTIEEIKENIRNAQDKNDKSTFSLEDSSEEINQAFDELIPVFDGIAYGLEISKELPNAAAMYRKQSENEIKKSLHLKVHQAIQEAKVEKYFKDRDSISQKGMTFLGGITGKNNLRLEKLNNINLKIQLTQCTVPEQQDEYSIRSMLADLYACATAELGGYFTPKMQELYNSIKNTYVDSRAGKFTDDYIAKLASEKIVKEQRNLPISQTKKRFFGKARAQIELLRLENKGLESKIIQERSKPRFSIMYQNNEPDALALVEHKLKIIKNSTEDKGVQKESEKNLENTADLWQQ